MPTIPVVRRLRQEEQVKGSLTYIIEFWTCLKPCLINKINKQTKTATC